MEDRCVCCGEIVPEGRMVCQQCEDKAEEMRMAESVEARAVKIAAKRMVEAGMCRYDDIMKCKRLHVSNRMCMGCIRKHLLRSAEKELGQETGK